MILCSFCASSVPAQAVCDAPGCRNAACDDHNRLVEGRNLCPAHAPRECDGHPAGPNDPIGVTVYCDGSCA